MTSLLKLKLPISNGAGEMTRLTGGNTWRFLILFNFLCQFSFFKIMFHFPFNMPWVDYIKLALIPTLIRTLIKEKEHNRQWWLRIISTSVFCLQAGFKGRALHLLIWLRAVYTLFYFFISLLSRCVRRGFYLLITFYFVPVK